MRGRKIFRTHGGDDRELEARLRDRVGTLSHRWHVTRPRVSPEREREGGEEARS